VRILAALLILSLIPIPALHAQQSAASIDLPARGRVILQAKGNGVQIYTCTASPGGAKWVFTAPEARLLDASRKQIGRHFVGPTWMLNDGSQVQGELIANELSPDARSIPWLFLRAKAGTATGNFASVAFIRRTETHGGLAPQSGCQTSQDAGKTAQVPYTATYMFYSASTDR